MNVTRPFTPRWLAAAMALAGLALSSCVTSDLPPHQTAPIAVTTPAAPVTASPDGHSSNPVPPPAPAPGSSAAEPLASKPSSPPPVTKLSVNEAIVAALERNTSLRVQRLAPDIQSTYEDQQQAAFDPTVTGKLQDARARSESPTASGDTATSRSDDVSASIGAQQTLSTGTTIGVDVSGSLAQENVSDRDFYGTRLGVSLTQPLLRGAKVEANLASLKQARLDTLRSEYELRAYAETLVANTEEQYWDTVLAQRQIEIYQESLALAQKQYDETRERITVGKLAQTELVAAEAESATRLQNLIDAKSALATARLQLLRYLNAPGGRLDGDVALSSLPQLQHITLDKVEEHVALGQRLRADVNQARLLLQKNELEIVKTRNGLLPKLDFFVTLGKTGYAYSFGDTAGNFNHDNYDLTAGLQWTWSPQNRDAKAQERRARLTKEQTAESIRNLEQLVEVDVRGAFIELQRAQEQVGATKASRILQEEKLRTETEKYGVGKSTSLLVAQAQRDLLSSQIAEVQAVVKRLKAQVELYRLEGSLLAYRGISCPGTEPVTDKAGK